MGSIGSDAITLWVWRRVRYTSGSGGALDTKTFKIRSAPAPIRELVPPSDPTVPPRIIAVHPTRTGKSTVFPLAITHWAEHAEGLKQGLTVCAQPRRILAQQLCERVRSNRKMRYNDRTVGYVIARESSRDTSTKLLYCTEAIAALMMQARLMSTAPPLPQDVNHYSCH